MARPKRCWSVRVGSRGHQVIAYERTLGGTLWVRWWVPALNGAKGKWHYRSLKHTDRLTAEHTAQEIASRLLTSTLAAETGCVTLAEILAIYNADVAVHSKGQGPKEAKRRTALWTAVLGADRDVETIDFPTIDRFVRDRRSGSIVLPGYELSDAPSDRAIGADIVFLQAALNHATKVMRPNHKRLLQANPLHGYPALRNQNPRRPVASYERFKKVLAHADAVDPQHLFAAFMTLVEGLGWRVSAICALRACDVDRRVTPDAPFGRIYKRPEQDKGGVGGWVPMNESVRVGIDNALAVNPALGEWPLFPAPRAKMEIKQGMIPKPWSRHHARKLLERAENAAKLERLDGSDFHAYRRAWASARKHLPVQDVASVGGWRDIKTLQTAYQQVDASTMLAVVLEPRKVREVKDSNEATG